MHKAVAIGPSSFAEEDNAPLRLLQAAGVEVKPNPYGRRLTEPEIIEHLKGVDGLLAGLEPLNRAVLASAAPRLKALARVGVGMTNVDLDAAREFGVRVSNTPDGPVNAVAEMTLAALLALCRKLIPSNTALHGGAWEKLIGTGLSGTPLLLIGYGRIGRRVGALLHAFDADVLVYDPGLDATPLPGVRRMASLEDGLHAAEIISLHASGEECILGAREFACMRDGVLLLNSARGGLVEEEALLTALDTGKVSGVWFDAFWQEPYTGRLREYPQALLTPHAGTYTRQCRRDMECAAVKNLLRDLGIQT